MIIGRREETQLIQGVIERGRANLIALYGRRRVGKTYLIRSTLGSEKNYLEITGRKGSPDREQIEAFVRSYAKVYLSMSEIPIPEKWNDVLEMYTRQIEKLKEQHHILFFDELPWLAQGSRKKGHSSLLAEIDYFWNTRWEKLPNLTVILCGSAASWMIRHIVNAKGGLYNRITQQIHLTPFLLGEAREFLEENEIKLNDFDLLELYLALGGIPHYLTLVPHHKSVSQIIEQLYFGKDAPLRREYDQLFQALFDDDRVHYQTMKLLAGCRQGILRKDLPRLLNSSAGKITKVLNELEASSFIKSYVPLGKHERDVFCKIVDEYSLFYLNWLEPLRGKSPGINYWPSVHQSPAWYSWAGYSFEALCDKHYQQILQALGISGVQCEISKWKTKGSKELGLPGAEIDLVIDRADRIINLCEIKFTREPFIVNKKILEEQQRRNSIFKALTKTKKSLMPVLISASGILQNQYSDTFAARTLQASDLVRSL